MTARRIAAAALALGLSLLGPAAAAQTPKAAPKTAAPPAKKGGQDDRFKADEKSFRSADGVKLRGLFTRGSNGPAGPVVLMLHALGANPDDTAWADLAKTLAENGYNVFRLDFRGHGRSTEVDPTDFWANPLNKGGVQGGSSSKSSIKHQEFRSGYFPMLVQDVAAARNQLDQMNDNGEVNTSTIYLLGAGDAAYLGTLFLATEWVRERVHPTGMPSNLPVSPRRGIFQGADPAGLDYGGAVWLGPAKPAGGGLGDTALKNAVQSPYALKLRNETPMLFVHGANDQKGQAAARELHNNVLLAKAKTGGSRGDKLQPVDPTTTLIKVIPKTGLAGAGLLGNKLPTETMVVEYLAELSKARKDRAKKTREWEKPLYIDLPGFGIAVR